MRNVVRKAAIPWVAALLLPCGLLILTAPSSQANVTVSNPPFPTCDPSLTQAYNLDLAEGNTAAAAQVYAQALAKCDPAAYLIYYCNQLQQAYNLDLAQGNISAAANIESQYQAYCTTHGPSPRPSQAPVQRPAPAPTSHAPTPPSHQPASTPRPTVSLCDGLFQQYQDAVATSNFASADTAYVKLHSTCLLGVGHISSATCTHLNQHYQALLAPGNATQAEAAYAQILSLCGQLTGLVPPSNLAPSPTPSPSPSASPDPVVSGNIFGGNALWWILCAVLVVIIGAIWLASWRINRPPHS